MTQRVREAHDEAVQLRRTARRRITEKYREIIEREVAEELARIDKHVAGVIRDELSNGANMGDIRWALRTNDKKVLDKYLAAGGEK